MTSTRHLAPHLQRKCFAITNFLLLTVNVPLTQASYQDLGVPRNLEYRTLGKALKEFT